MAPGSIRAGIIQPTTAVISTTPRVITVLAMTSL